MNQSINANWEIVKVERKDGEFKREDGTSIVYKQYWVYFKKEDNPLIFRAKVEKVFNDYVEDSCEPEF